MSNVEFSMYLSDNACSSSRLYCMNCQGVLGNVVTLNCFMEQSSTFSQAMNTHFASSWLVLYFGSMVEVLLCRHVQLSGALEEVG